MKKTTIIFICALSIFNISQASESLPITPGLWEITSTTTNPFLGTRTHSSQECMTELKIDPQQMMEGMPKDACDINSNVSGNTIKYDLNCDIDGNKMTGQGAYTVEGDNATGNMIMTSSIAGQTIEMKMQSIGKRIGDC